MRFKTEGLGGYDFSGLLFYAFLILGALLLFIVFIAGGTIKAMKSGAISPIAGWIVLVLLILGPVLAFFVVL